MKCKKIHSKVIFFLEKELPDSEMIRVKEHLSSCSECTHFVEEMKRTLSIFDEEKSAEVNPFFYTRVKARLQSQEQEVYAGRPVLARILQPLAFSILLIIGIYGGIKLGEPYKSAVAVNVLSDQQMIPYLNEMDAEPIETFLMK